MKHELVRFAIRVKARWILLQSSWRADWSAQSLTGGERIS
jgi:hypothetical protein